MHAGALQAFAGDGLASGFDHARADKGAGLEAAVFHGGHAHFRAIANFIVSHPGPSKLVTRRFGFASRGPLRL